MAKPMLEVSFTGLSVIIPKQSKVHILMVSPATTHGGDGQDDHRHYPRVFYDGIYDDPSAKIWRAVALDKMILDLSGQIAGTRNKGGDIKDYPDLVDITPYTTALPNPTADNLSGLVSRVTLPLADEIDDPDAKGAWEVRQPQIGNKKMPKAAWRVVWKFNNIDPEGLKWGLKGFGGMRDFALAPLKPRGDPPKIELFISNVIATESGPPEAVPPSPVSANTKMPHFDALRDLYANAGPTADPWPEVVFLGQTTGRGTPYSCLPSGGH